MTTDAVEKALAPFTPDKPGLAVLVSIAGEPVFERYLGGADLEHGAPVTAKTRFHVASVTKQFTALAALLESEAGRLDLDADIHDFLPELADYGVKVTPRHLVHHTSGLRDHWELTMLSGTTLDGMVRQSALVSIAARQRGLNFPPGSDYRYSNTGYTLLAEIVARTSGKPLPNVLEEAVFAPLGMRDTVLYGDATRLLRDRAMSYRIDPKGEVRLARLNYSNHGATSLHSTPRDLAQWAQELMHPRLFAPELIAKFTAPTTLNDGSTLNYAFGIANDVLGGRPSLTHAGGDAGFRAAFDCYPQDDASVIVLANGAADTAAIARTLADAFLSPAAGHPDPVAPDPAALERLAGYYVTGWGPGVTMEAADGKLTVSGPAGPMEAKFLPSGEFYLFGPAYRFSERPDGGLSLSQGVGIPETLHRRAIRVQPSAEDLTALAGRYFSEEVDCSYDLAVDGQGLTLSCLRWPPLKLAPADQDAFDGPSLRLDFQRDAGGAPTGFTASTGRTRGVAFRRV